MCDTLEDMKHKRGRPLKEKRNKEILERRQNGWTLKALSAEYGVSKPRISQIVKQTASL